MTNLSEALAAYKICAQTEAKSQRTSDWIIDIVGYFSKLLGDTNTESVYQEVQINNASPECIIDRTFKLAFTLSIRFTAIIWLNLRPRV